MSFQCGYDYANVHILMGQTPGHIEDLARIHVAETGMDRDGEDESFLEGVEDAIADHAEKLAGPFPGERGE